MSKYEHVKDCLEGARNGKFCAGAETAATEIERLQTRVEGLEGALGEIVSLIDRHHSEVPHYNKFLFIARKASKT